MLHISADILLRRFLISIFFLKVKKYFLLTAIPNVIWKKKLKKKCRSCLYKLLYLPILDEMKYDSYLDFMCDFRNYLINFYL